MTKRPLEGLASSSNDLVRRVVNDYMEPVHSQIYGPAGKWKANQVPVRPSGIQTLSVNGRSDIWPSWYNSKTSGTQKSTLYFNKYTKTLATDCTQEAYKIAIDASKVIDPMTKKEVWFVPEGYDKDTKDDCSYAPPSVELRKNGDHLEVRVIRGSKNLARFELSVNGSVVESGDINNTTFQLQYEFSTDEKDADIKITISDEVGYSVSDTL